MFHVKPSGTALPSIERIRAALDCAGIGATEEQLQQLAAHAAVVLDANTTTNLTRITEPNDFVRLHILDSLMPLTFVDLLQGSVIDIGAGAGFPGIPLAIMGAEVTLCEARQKKAVLLERWSKELHLDVVVHAIRAEELIVSGGGFQWVIARAVSSLSSLVELAAPLLKPGGCLVAMKGVRDSEEEARGVKVAGMAGLVVGAVHEYLLPNGPERRTIYILRRENPPQVVLPRRAGLAQKQPLA